CARPSSSSGWAFDFW
nr:immunoglobulin heavy chain junction region [Macaca mulatta]